jgi:hypothetical protein
MTINIPDRLSALASEALAFAARDKAACNAGKEAGERFEYRPGIEQG